MTLATATPAARPRPTIVRPRRRPLPAPRRQVRLLRRICAWIWSYQVPVDPSWQVPGGAP